MFKRFCMTLVSTLLCCTSLIWLSFPAFSESTAANAVFGNLNTIGCSQPLSDISTRNSFTTQIDNNKEYNYDSLILSNLPDYIAKNTLNPNITAIKLDTADNDELFSFTTINSDGSKSLYLFNDPVKFVDKNKVRFIDNTITQRISSENEPEYTNSLNAFDLTMPKTLSKGISLKMDDISITMTPFIGGTSQAFLKDTTFRGLNEQVIEYRDVFAKGIHLQYTPINSGLKENIIMENYTGINVFKFYLDVGNAYPIYTEGESIPFASPVTDEIVFIVGQIDAKDSYIGEQTDGHFTLYNSLKVEEFGEKYILTVTVDKEFLTSPNTVYPVIIDPTVTIASSNMQDTSVYSAKKNTQTFYSSAYNIVGNHGDSYGEGIAFIKMTNLGNYTNIDPAKITTAYYNVYEGSGKTNSMTIQVRTPSSTWSQTSITYENMPSLSSPTTSLTISKSGRHNFDVTQQVRDWIKYERLGTGLNKSRGIALKASSTGISSKHFCSANYSGTTTPALIINYTDSNYHINNTYDLTIDFTAWGRLINGDSPVFSFYVDSPGTYVIETLQSTYFGSGTQTTDTKMELLNSSYSRLYYDDNSGTGNYAKITATLSQGTYRLNIYDNNGLSNNVKCYVIIEGFLGEDEQYASQAETLYFLGELSANNSMYANQIKEFYKKEDASTDDNCLTYALGQEALMHNVDTLAESLNFFEGLGYTASDTPTSNCIIIYGVPEKIGHFAKRVNGRVYSKIGDAEYVAHPYVDAYYPKKTVTDNIYGAPVKYFYK